MNTAYLVVSINKIENEFEDITGVYYVVALSDKQKLTANLKLIKIRADQHNQYTVGKTVVLFEPGVKA